MGDRANDAKRRKAAQKVVDDRTAAVAKNTSFRQSSQAKDQAAADLQEKRNDPGTSHGFQTPGRRQKKRVGLGQRIPVTQGAALNPFVTSKTDKKSLLGT